MKCFICGKTASELKLYDVCNSCAEAQREEEIRQTQAEMHQAMTEMRIHFLQEEDRHA